jgi:hypothetical protein
MTKILQGRDIAHMTVIFVVNFIMYAQIWWIAQRHANKITSDFQKGVRTCRPRKRVKLDKVTLMVFTVTVVSYVLWCSHLISTITGTNMYNKMGFGCLGFCNSLLNNMLYACFNTDFRQAYRKLLSCKNT